MQYKLLGENNIKKPIETIFKNRNIDNYKKFLEVGKDDELDYMLLDNIMEGVELLANHLQEDSLIQVIVDSDADGLTSSAVLIKYIKQQFPNANIEYTLHTGKQHGLSDDIKINDNVNLVILPDASSNDYEQHKKLKDKGIDILILDHHEADKYSECACVINNQLSPNYSNKSLSGVGIVYKFIKAMDDYYFTDYADEYLDLVALGNVADSMNLYSKETRYYVKNGIDNVNNRFLKALINKNSYSLEGKYNIMSIGWVIAPQLNSVIRAGKQEEKELMFKALLEEEMTFNEFKPRGSKETVEEDLQTYMARICGNVKSRQDNAVKKAIPLIENKLNIDNKLLIADVTEILDSNYTGLVAGKIVEKYNSPVILYRNVDNVLVGGSGRGTDKVIKDLKEFLNNSNQFEFCQGHKQAFGFKFNIDNLNNIIDYANKELSKVEIEPLDLYWVDFIINADELDYWFVNGLCKYENEWGNSLEEPLIAIEDIIIDTSNIELKGDKSKNTIFEYNQIKFIKKHTKVEEYLDIVKKEKQIQKDKEIKINLVGRCRTNYYNDTFTPQIEIIDMETRIN